MCILSLLSPQCMKQCPPYIRHSVNICSSWGDTKSILFPLTKSTKLGDLLKGYGGNRGNLVGGAEKVSLRRDVNLPGKEVAKCKGPKVGADLAGGETESR